jgi:hypothetical protein
MKRLSSILDELKIRLGVAAREIFPRSRNDRPVSPVTLMRWIVHGVKLPDGSRLRLEGIKCGHAWLTSREAVRRFLERQTAAALGEQTDVTPPTAGHGEETERKLDAILGPVA